MTDDAPSNGPATPDAPASEPPTAPACAATAEVHPGGSLTNADIAALSRERLETLLSILPPAVAAILITNRPPMPPHVEYEAHRKLVTALARARARIPSVPMDKTVNYVSKRTGEQVHYSFASLDAIHKTVTGPLSEQGLVIECILNGDVIVVLLSHEGGGIHLSWLPLPDEGDIKDLATQITMRRRYLTTQLIAIVADEDTGERDIAEPKKGSQRRGSQPGQGQQRRTAAPPAGRGAAPGGSRQQAPAGAEQLASRTNTLLAKLPKDVADELRRRHKDPNELLRRTTEELNRRNAARSGSSGDNAAAGDTQPGQPAAGQPGSPQAATEGAGRHEGQPPANPQVEKHINDGMRALKLSPDEQTALRKQFQGDPNGLLEHIKALYNARDDGERTS